VINKLQLFTYSEKSSPFLSDLKKLLIFFAVLWLDTHLPDFWCFSKHMLAIHQPTPRALKPRRN